MMEILQNLLHVVTNLHCLDLLLYAGIGFLEWLLAVKRTSAIANNQKALLISIVFVENLAGLLVLQRFIQQNDWIIAVVYSLGASLGALFAMMKYKNKEEIHEKPL